MKAVVILPFVMAGAVMLSGCAPSKSISVIYSDQYDASKDETSVMILPYGKINIPGKWKNTRYSEISGQYFFQGPDSTTFAVALMPRESYTFYKEGMSPWAFVNDFYEWDSNYLRQERNGQISIVKADEEQNFIIWNLKAQQTNGYFLFGLKNITAFNLYITDTKWDEEKTVELLEQIYLE